MKYQDPESEKRLLSAMMNSPDACTEVLNRLQDSDFTDKMNRDIFNLIESLFCRNVKPTLVEVLLEGQKLGFINNPQRVDEIKRAADAQIDEENLQYWINNVKRNTKGRQLQKIFKDYNSLLNQGEVETVLSRAEQELFSLQLETETERIITPEEFSKEGYKVIEERAKEYRKRQEENKLIGEVLLEGVNTGYETLNKLSLGYKAGDLIIIGAETGHGKTALALNTTKAGCIDSTGKILYINTEMSRKQIAYRCGAMLAGVPLQQIRNGSVTNQQLQDIKSEYERLRLSGFTHITIPNLTPSKLITVAKQAKLRYDIDMIIVDYVGRMETLDPRLQEWQMLYQIIKNQKMLAQNLEVACMALVQLNENGSIQGAKKMKNECDLMLKLIPCDDDECRQVEEKNKKVYEPFNYRIYIEKSRDSASGVSIPLVFDKEKQIIREAQAMGREI